MHLLLHDYANYAFTKQLAAELASTSLRVTYAYNAQYDGPNSQADPRAVGHASLLPIQSGLTGRPSESFFKRLRIELAYARQLSRHAQQVDADVILSANTPSLVQNRLAKTAQACGVPLLSWVQDLYGVAAHKLLRKRLPVVGSLIGRYFIALDRQSLRQSQQCVLITDDFRDFVLGSGVADERIHVVENWAPIKDIPRVARDNAWARQQQLSDCFRFVYSGTLAMKHNPQLLVQLAQRLCCYAEQTNTSAAELLVVSSSPGARWLSEQVKQLRLTNVRLMDFQPAASFPSILGSADVLLAVLEQDAAAFSVPSKVLSYLCAGKPILAAIPGANLAARIICNAQAGRVIEPTEPMQFAEAGLEMMQAGPDRLQAWGSAARAYAEQNFDMQQITSRFRSILQTATSAGTVLCQPTAACQQ